MAATKRYMYIVNFCLYYNYSCIFQNFVSPRHKWSEGANFDPYAQKPIAPHRGDNRLLIYVIFSKIRMNRLKLSRNLRLYLRGYLQFEDGDLVDLELFNVFQVGYDTTHQERETWSNSFEFLLSMLGWAVGFGRYTTIMHQMKPRTAQGARFQRSFEIIS